jgi:2-keto-4-pentenoate hydratase
MPTADQESAAQYLFAARTRGTPGARIPEAFRPADIDAALAIQQRVAALVGADVGGWKCSVPSAARTVLAAPIFAPTIHRSSPCPLPAAGDIAKIEPEIAFRLGRDLPPRATPYSEEEIRAAIGAAHLVIELIGGRYNDPSSVGYPELLADGVANAGLFVGPAVANPFERTLEHFPLVVRAASGPLHTREGKHPDGHPLPPLYWLANYLAARGDFLRASQVVTTGSYAGLLEVPVDTPLTFVYGDLGEFTVTFTPAA